MRHTPDIAMLFAAGLGTRMRPLTLTRPKALVEVHGTALIDHALGYCDAADIARKVVNTHAHAAQLATHLAPRRDVVLSHEPQLLDTGGGLRAALPALGEDPVVTLNTDAIFVGPNPITALQDAWAPDRMDALLLLVPQARAVGHAREGDFRLSPEGHIGWNGPWTYTGAQIMKTDWTRMQPPGAFSLRRGWKTMIESGRAFGLVYAGHWADVGTPDGISLAETLLDAPHV